MNEMTPAERVSLDTLRATALAKMSDADFANLETEVASKGLRNLDGWFGAQVAKAVEQVLKHPGHANQASHGGKGGGGSSAPAPSGGGGGRGVFTTNKENRKRIDENVTLSGFDPKAKVKSVKDTSPSQMMDKLSVHGGGGGYHVTRRDAKAQGRDVSRADEMLVGHAKQNGWSMRNLMEFSNSKNGRTFADLTTDRRPPSGNDLSRATNLLNEGAGNGTVGKSVEPVEKHPGHANQASHGGGKGGGSSSAPASSGGGGGGGGSFKPAQSEALIKDADDGLRGATLSARSIRNQHDLQLSGGTRDRALVKHDEAMSSLRAAKRNVDLAAQLNGSDRGSVQVNMKAARVHAQKAKGHMAEAYKIARLDTSKSKSFKSFDDAIAKIEGAVMEGTDGGVF